LYLVNTIFTFFY